jgi:hypothetical protein
MGWNIDSAIKGMPMNIENAAVDVAKSRPKTSEKTRTKLKKRLIVIQRLVYKITRSTGKYQENPSRSSYAYS